jgi:hypothetical protein
MNGARAEGPAQIAGKPEAQSPIAMIAVRYQAMQRMYVSFKIQTTFSLGRDPATVEQAVPLDGGMVVDTLVGTQIGKGSFSFLNGMARYEMHWQPLPSQKKRGQAEWTDVESYGTERIENLTNVHDNRWEGAIDKTGKLPSFMDSSSTNIDIALGLRLCTSNEWLTNGALKEMNVSLPDPEHVVLSNTPKSPWF